jgi:hypothetical protein
VDIYDLFNKRVKIIKSDFSNPIPNTDTIKLYCLNYFFSGCDMKKRCGYLGQNRDKIT